MYVIFYKPKLHSRWLARQNTYPSNRKERAEQEAAKMREAGEYKVIVRYVDAD